jgi:hypothetical protein
MWPLQQRGYDIINEIPLNLIGACSNIFRYWGFIVVEMLWILGGLNVALFFATFSCAKSLIEQARRRGMEEATRELTKGFNSHFELEGQALPERVSIALKGLKEVSSKTWKSDASLTEPYHAQLWVLGDAMGEACWIKGHAAGVRRKATAPGKVRIDFSLNELLQLSWLAHLGFQHMMPNYRSFEIHRFSGPDDAREGASAVGKIECAIPAKDRPFTDLSAQVKSRQKLIGDWWQVAPNQLTA